MGGAAHGPSAGEQRRIGNWVLGAHLGSGSFAVVWRARHTATGEEAAVKEINLERLNAKLRQSLESEVSILQRIEHTNIVKLIEVLQVGKGAACPLRWGAPCAAAWRATAAAVSPLPLTRCAPFGTQHPHESLGPPTRQPASPSPPQDARRMYLVMEYCAGGDLAALLRARGRLPEGDARALLAQLAAGLREMWAHHLVHVRPPTSLPPAISLLPLGLLGWGRARAGHSQEHEQQQASGGACLPRVLLLWIADLPAAPHLPAAARPQAPEPAALGGGPRRRAQDRRLWVRACAAPGAGPG